MDHKGAPVSAAALAEANATLHRLSAKAGTLGAELAQRRKDLARAELEAREAHAALAAVKAEHALARSHHKAKEVRLERVRALVDQRLAELGPLDLRIRILEGLRFEHGFLRDQAEGLLEQALEGEAGTGAVKAAPALDRALESFARDALRMDRLDALMRRLEKRCDRLRGRVGPALKEQRWVKPRTGKAGSRAFRHSGDDVPRRRRRGRTPPPGSGACHLVQPAQALLPRAEEAQEELDRLDQRLKTGLERGKKWLAAWKEAGKGERAALAQAEALAIDAGLQAEKAVTRARDLAGRLEPVVRALTPICSADTAALLARAVEKTAEAGIFSQKEQERADELRAAVPQPRPVKLSRPPMALKPVSTAARRLSGKRVELDHLRAVLASARRFSDLAMGPIHRRIRRPAEEVALALSASLASMTANRNQLAGENLHHRENIKKLRASLKGERELSGRRQELLDRARLETRGPGQDHPGAKGRACRHPGRPGPGQKAGKGAFRKPGPWPRAWPRAWNTATSFPPP